MTNGLNPNGYVSSAVRRATGLRSFWLAPTGHTSRASSRLWKRGDAMADPTVDPMVKQSHDGAILDLCKTLINSIVSDSETVHGDTPRERLKNQVKHRSDPNMVGAIAALSTYGLARATERQATATEMVAKAMGRLQPNGADNGTVDETAAAMVEMREPKRDYLASTYSLPTDLLLLLWSVRGMVMDASVRSLSKPERFEPYRVLKTDEIAWSLRVEPRSLVERLPRMADGSIDYDLLEDFGIMRYGGTPDEPDDWMYGG